MLITAKLINNLRLFFVVLEWVFRQSDGYRIDEREFAKENASNAGLDIVYLEIPSSPSANLIESYIQAEEEPNSIPEPAVFLCQEARKMGVEVLYSALGPDEIFGGYEYFSTIQKLKKFGYF